MGGVCTLGGPESERLLNVHYTAWIAQTYEMVRMLCCYPGQSSARVLRGPVHTLDGVLTTASNVLSSAVVRKCVADRITAIRRYL